MADPATIGLGLSIGSKLLGGLGSLKAGKAQKRQAFEQAREAENTGEANVLRIREQARKAIGEQAAAQAGNGFLGGTGSAIDALQESQVNAALDALQVRRDAAMRARSYRAEGKQALKAGKYALAESMLGAAGSAFGAADDWAQARRGQVPAGGGMS